MSPPSDIPPKIRVLCVDDSRDITEILGRCIDHEPDMECAGCLDTADGLASEIKERRADVVLMDLKMPGKEPLAALKDGVEARVIVFSGRDDQEAIDSATEAGASGFLSKDAEVLVILGAIREVAARQGSEARFGVWR